MNCNKNSHIFSSEWCIFTAVKSINKCKFTFDPVDWLATRPTASSELTIHLRWCWRWWHDTCFHIFGILVLSYFSSFSFSSRKMFVAGNGVFVCILWLWFHKKNIFCLLHCIVLYALLGFLFLRFSLTKRWSQTNSNYEMNSIRWNYFEWMAN